MSDKGAAPEKRPAWKALRAHQKEFDPVHIRELFADDPGRESRFSARACGIRLDYSRHLITAQTIALLADLIREAGVEDLRDRMFAGEHINTTEDRAVLHVALRAARKDRFRVGQQDCTADVHAMLERMEIFVRGVHEGSTRGYGSRRPFTDVVNIGIGGSDLGVEMGLAALYHHRLGGLRVHTVSNIDGTGLADLVREINPRTTLFIVCSKTFTTEETMANARSARQWIEETLGPAAVPRHFAAVSTNSRAMDEFGVNRDSRFGIWDWVGGRYSVWSAMGLALALSVGMDHFRAFLAGGRAMDRHFSEAPPGENLPMLLAMLSVWYNDFLGANSQAILPYDWRLRRFPAFLQQLHMESNGKSVSRYGRPIRVPTGTIIWGEAGNNAQHSFYQLLHQGTRYVPVDFIAPDEASGPYADQHRAGLVNMLAQAKALAFGRTIEEVTSDLEAQGLDRQGVRRLALHKVHRGNRPSTLIRFRRLDPRTLGSLVALYEHKVFTEGAIWGINSFDQWGVELGKRLAREIQGKA